jgi:hypothetical protein
MTATNTAEMNAVSNVSPVETAVPVKKVTPSQQRAADLLAVKKSGTDLQRLTLVHIANNKQNRAASTDVAQSVIEKTLKGHFQAPQNGDYAAVIVRAACGLEAAMFDRAFMGFVGNKSQHAHLLEILSDPYAFLNAELAGRRAARQSGDVNTADEKAQKAVDKAMDSKGAEKVRKLCATFLATYGHLFVV